MRPRPDGTGAAALSSTACQRGRGHRGWALPKGQGWTNGVTACHVVLTGRATSVPFTVVLTGPERTTTDNAKAASTCAEFCPRR
jgi:hypothetical protein